MLKPAGRRAATMRWRRSTSLGLGLTIAIVAGCGGGDAGPLAPASSGSAELAATGESAPPPTTVGVAPAPAPSPSPAPAPVTTPVVGAGTWTILGSSSAQGVGAQTLSWAQALQRTYAYRAVSIVNLAVGGTTTYEALPSDSPTVAGRPGPATTFNIDAALATSPKLVLVSYPTNDTAEGYTVDETVRNLLTIRSTALSRGVPVVIVSTQPRDLNATQLARLVEIDGQVSQAVGPCFVAVSAALAGPDGRIAPQYDAGDGIHVNDSGHALIHDRIAALIDGGGCVTTVAP
jgi:lysophospholipase L1-like esterase